MLGRLMPREGRFFELFDQHAERIAEGAGLLVTLMQDYGDVATRNDCLDRIDAIEVDADRIAHETFALLHRTLVTPFDREDIHRLISAMDDVLDLTHDVAESMVLYDIGQVSPEALRLASLSHDCCDRVRAAVGLLGDMRNGAAILDLCARIDALESDADRVMRSAMSKLFRDEPDLRQVIKMKAVYELLESLTDRCEDVAGLLEAMVLDHA